MRNLKKFVMQYSYFLEYDSDDRIFMARCTELPDLIAHGETQEGAFREIKKVVAEALKWMSEEGESLPEPFSLHKYSGEFRLRMPPEKHKKIAMEAALQGISMNQLIVNKL